MAEPPTIEATGVALGATLGVLYRKIRQTKGAGDLTLPEGAAISRLRINGPMSSAELAKLEQISPQSMGATVASLIERGLVQRTPDPDDGRRHILTLTVASDRLHQARRNVRAQQLGRALTRFSAEERAQIHAVLPLLERLADELEA